MASSESEKVAIIGCGMIGHSWSLMFAAAGYRVSIYDVNAELLLSARQRIRDRLVKLEAEGLSRSSDSVDAVMDRVSTCAQLADCVDGACYVQECVLEDVELKQRVFGQIDALPMGADTVLASSTSTILPSVISQQMKHRSQFVVVHPVNPPIYCPAVEIVPAPWTDAAVVDRAVQVVRNIGQVPIRLNKEVVGFAVNRLQYAVIAEAWRMAKSGVLSVEDVNAVMSEGFGLRYAFFGPLQVSHMNADGIRAHNRTYGPGFDRVLQDAGPPPDLNQPDDLELIAGQLEQQIPVERLAEWRQYRERCLAELAVLKRKLLQHKPTN